jgi:hypothetical protein
MRKNGKNGKKLNTRSIYLETATWLASDFTFCEVLLTCSHLKYPHTGEVISDGIIDQWRLKNTIFTIFTDKVPIWLKL